MTDTFIDLPKTWTWGMWKQNLKKMDIFAYTQAGIKLFR